MNGKKPWEIAAEQQKEQTKKPWELAAEKQQTSEAVEGDSANFTNASSEQSEGGGTTQSEVSSQPSQTGGTTPAKPSVLTEQEDTFTPFVTKFAKEVNEQSNTIQGIREEIKALSTTMIRPDVSRDERVAAAKKREQLSENLNKAVEFQLSSIKEQEKDLRRPVTKYDEQLASAKALMFDSGLFKETDSGLESTTNLSLIENKINSSVDEMSKRTSEELASVWDKEYKPRIEQLQKDPNATQEQLDSLVEEYNQRIATANDEVNQYYQQLLGAANEKLDDRSKQELQLITRYNQLADEKNAESEAYQRNLKLLYDRESSLKALKGDFGGYVQNMVTEMYGDYLSGISEAMATYFIQPVTEMMGAPEVSREDVRAAASSVGESFKKAVQDEETSPEFVERVSEEDFVTRSVVGGLGSLPLMATPAMTGVFFSAYKNAGDEVAAQGLTDTEKELYQVSSGMIEYSLERLGMAKVLSKNPVLKRAVLGRVLPKMTQKTTAKQLQNLITNEVEKLPKSAAMNFIEGSLSEGATGGLQAVGQIGLKEMFNAVKADEVFDSKSLEEYAQEIGSSAAEELVGSLLLTGAVNSATSFSDGNVNEITEGELEAAQMLAENPEEAIKLIRKSLSNEPKGYVEDIAKKATLLSESLQKLPPALRTSKQALGLIRDKAELEAQNEKLDPAFTKRNKEKIQAIELQLESLVNKQQKDDTQRRQTQETQEGTVRDRQQQPTQEEAQGSEVSEETQGREGEQQAELPTEDGTRGEEDVQGTVTPLTESLKTPRIAKVGGTFDKALRGERINESEIAEAQEALLEELEVVENSNAPQETKDRVAAEIERAFNELDNYEFTTETKTRATTKKKPTRVVRESVREQAKSPQERLVNREVNRVEGTEFTAEGFEPTEGTTTVLEEQDGKYVLQEFDETGKRTRSQELEISSPADLELVETIKDENGNVVGATVKNKNNDGEVFSFMDEDLALDFAIDKTKAEVGEMTFEEEQIFEQYEELKPRKDATKERKQQQDREQQREETQGGGIPTEPSRSDSTEQDGQVQEEAEAQATQEEVETPTEKLAKAGDNLKSAWEQWKQKQQNVGVAFDPKSSAEEDVKLLTALVDYLKAVGAKTVDDVIRYAKTFSNGELELTREGAEVIAERAKPTQEDIQSWNQRAEEFGFDNAPQAINSVNKRLGKKYKTVDQIPDQDLRAASTQRGSERKLSDDAKKAVADGMTVDEFVEANEGNFESQDARNAFERAVAETETTEESFEKQEESFKKQSEDVGRITKNKSKIRRAGEAFIKAFFDAKIEIKNALKKAGLTAAADKIQNIAGAAGRGKFLYSQAYNKIFKGLTEKQKENLDKIIFARRMITIDKNREDRGLKPITHPDFTSRARLEKYLEGLKQQIGDKEFKNLNDRADAYFDTFREMLDRMQESGLISKEVRDALYELDYSPRKFIQHLVNPEGELDERAINQIQNSTGLSRDQIVALDEGSANSLVRNSEWLLSTALNQREKAIMYNNLFNRIAKGLKGKAEEQQKQEGVLDNPVIGYTKEGNPKFKYDKAPKGFQTVNYRENGEQRKIFLSNENYDSLFGIPASKMERRYDLSPETRAMFRRLSGSNILKFLATGANPFFVLGNFPNDFGHTIMFETSYSSFLPKAIAQLGRDLVTAYKNIYTKDERFRDFVMNGGMMDFLYMQGRLGEKSKLKKSVDKLISFAVDPRRAREISRAIGDFFLTANEYSELGFRMAIYNRVFNQEMERINNTEYETQEDKELAIQDAKDKAVARARGIIDFNQAGYITKAADSGMAYLNAAAQGSYKIAQAMVENPVRTATLGIQAGAMISGSVTALSVGALSLLSKGDDDDEDKLPETLKRYAEARDKISPYTKRRYFTVFTGRQNEEGELEYIKIRKTIALTPVFLTSEHIMDNYIRKSVGMEEIDNSYFMEQMRIASEDDVAPLPITSLISKDPLTAASNIGQRIPAATAMTILLTGYDPFRRQYVTRDIGDTPSWMEGYGDEKIPEFYKKLGEKTEEISPARYQRAIESIITNERTNPMVGAIYAVPEMITTGDPKKVFDKAFKKLDEGASARVFGYTSSYVQSFARRDRLQKKIDQQKAEDIKAKVAIRDLAEDYTLAKAKSERKEITKKLAERLKVTDEEDQMNLFNRFVDQVKYRNKGIPSIYFDIKYTQSPEIKALYFVDYFGTDFSEEEMKEFKKYSNMVDYKPNKEFLLEVKRLIDEEKQ